MLEAALFVGRKNEKLALKRGRGERHGPEHALLGCKAFRKPNEFINKQERGRVPHWFEQLLDHGRDRGFTAF